MCSGTVSALADLLPSSLQAVREKAKNAEKTVSNIFFFENFDMIKLLTVTHGTAKKKLNLTI
jgi:hypothetical protein